MAEKPGKNAQRPVSIVDAFNINFQVSFVNQISITVTNQGHDERKTGQKP
jgi:hypothetical protein